MAAYATAQRASQTQLRVLNTEPAAPAHPGSSRESGDLGLVDELLARLADLVAERLADRLAAPAEPADEWLDAGAAAAYLDIHRDTLRRLAAQRSIPSEQQGAGCKLYFRRSDLETWRCSARTELRAVATSRSRSQS